jgi:hypothetical protein
LTTVAFIRCSRNYIDYDKITSKLYRSCKTYWHVASTLAVIG